MSDFLLQEDGTKILQEDSSGILTVDSPTSIPIGVGILAIVGLSLGVGFHGPSTGNLTFTGYAPAIGGGSAESIPVPAGALSLQGQYVGIALGPSAPAGSLQFTGYALSIGGGATSIPIPAGSLRFSGQVLTLLPGGGIQIPAGSLALQGRYIGVQLGPIAPAGDLRFTGYAPNPNITPSGGTAIPAGSLVLRGQNLQVGFIGPPTGDLRFTGRVPAVSINPSGGAGSINIPAGALALAGQYVGVSFIGPDTGNLRFTGYASPPNVTGGNVSIPIVNGVLRYTGLALTIPGAQSIPIPAGGLRLQGRQPLVSYGAVQVPSGALRWRGYAPFALTPGSVSLTNYNVSIEGEFNGVWAAFGTDLILRDGIRWKRGNENTGPTDGVAVAGTCEFTLRNDPNCTGGRGYYSPNHTNCRPGFIFGLPIRVIYTAQGMSITRWTGKLRVIDPTEGLYGEQVTRCLATDAIDDLAESDVREVTVQINQTEDALLNAIFDVLPVESQPIDRNFDAGVDILPVAFDDVGSGSPGLSVADRVVTSARGRLFLLGDGTMRYKNRNTISTTIPAYSFSDSEAVLEVPSNLENVFNRIRLVGHPKSFSPSTIVLSTHDGTLDLDPGASVEQFLQYRDPTNPDTQIGGTGFIDPLVAMTDYVWNAAADGSGANLTGNINIVADFFITSVKLTITNTGGTKAYKQLLQVRGTGIYNYSPVTVERYESRPYGNRPVEIDLPYQDDIEVLTSGAEFIKATYIDLSAQVKSVTFYPQKSAALMLEALLLEIADVVHVVDPQILPRGAHAMISAIEMETDADGILICRLTTAPWVVDPVLFTDGVGVADVLTYSSATPESRIDFALIDYSEIA